MPYVKLSELSNPKKDRLKADLLERMDAYNMTNAQMAEAMQISRSTFQRLMKAHTDEWTLEQITLAFRAVKTRISVNTL